MAAPRRKRHRRRRLERMHRRGRPTSRLLDAAKAGGALAGLAAWHRVRRRRHEEAGRDRLALERKHVRRDLREGRTEGW